MDKKRETFSMQKMFTPAKLTSLNSNTLPWTLFYSKCDSPEGRIYRAKRGCLCQVNFEHMKLLFVEWHFKCVCLAATRSAVVGLRRYKQMIYTRNKYHFPGKHK